MPYSQVPAHMISLTSSSLYILWAHMDFFFFLGGGGGEGGKHRLIFERTALVFNVGNFDCDVKRPLSELNRILS